MVEGVSKGDQCVPSLPDALADDEAVWAHAIPHLEKGCLLVCAPNVSFRNLDHSSLLERSVLLLLEHSDEMGSLAIALNRPTDNELGDVLERESLRRAFADAPLHLGGTSSIDDAGRSNVWMLAATRGRTRDEHEEFVGADGAEPVLPGLWLGTATGAAKRVDSGEAPASAFHFFAGAFVWDAGELEAEVEAGAWLPASASSAALKEHMLGDVRSPEVKYQTALGWVRGAEGLGPEELAADDDDDDEGFDDDDEDEEGELMLEWDDDHDGSDLRGGAGVGTIGLDLPGGSGGDGGGGLEITGVASEKLYGSLRDVDRLVVSTGATKAAESKAAKSLMAVRDVLGAVQTWVRLVSETRAGRLATKLDDEEEAAQADRATAVEGPLAAKDSLSVEEAAAGTFQREAGELEEPQSLRGSDVDDVEAAEEDDEDEEGEGAREVSPPLGAVLGAAHRWLRREDDVYDDSMTVAEEAAQWEASVEPALSLLAARCLERIGGSSGLGSGLGGGLPGAASAREGSSSPGTGPMPASSGYESLSPSPRAAPPAAPPLASAWLSHLPEITKLPMAERVGAWIESLMRRGELSSSAAADAAAPQAALEAIREVLLDEAWAHVIPDEQPALDVHHLSLPNRLAALADAIRPASAAAPPAAESAEATARPKAAESAIIIGADDAARVSVIGLMVPREPPPLPIGSAERSRSAHAAAEAARAANARVAELRQELSEAVLSMEIVEGTAREHLAEGRHRAAQRELRHAQASLERATAALEQARLDAVAAAEVAEAAEAAAEAEAEAEAAAIAAEAAAEAAAAEAAEAAASGWTAQRPRPRSPVALSSLQLGLVTVLLAERVGLRASLVDVDGCGLLLRADLGEHEEPVYVSLAPDESCFRTLSRRDCALAVLQMDEPSLPGLPADHDEGLSGLLEHRLPPLHVGSLLVEEWSEAFRVGGDRLQADFWDVQRHTLRRLAKRLAEAEGGESGAVGSGGSESGRGGAKRAVGKRGLGGPNPGDITGVVLRLPKRLQRLDHGDDDFDI